jgi:hypothetical protein
LMFVGFMRAIKPMEEQEPRVVEAVA